MQPQFYGGSFPAQPSPASKFWTKRKLAVLGVVFLVLLVIGLGVSSVSSGDNGEKVADNFMVMLYSGDPSTSYKLLDSEAQSHYSEENWASLVTLIKANSTTYTTRDKPKTTASSGGKLTSHTYTLTNKDTQTKTVAWVEIITLKSGSSASTVNRFRLNTQ